MTDKQITVHKLFSLKAIRVSSFFFGIFGVTLMVVSNLKVFENLAPEKSLSPFLKKNTLSLTIQKCSRSCGYIL